MATKSPTIRSYTIVEARYIGKNGKIEFTSTDATARLMHLNELPTTGCISTISCFEGCNHAAATIQHRCRSKLEENERCEHLESILIFATSKGKCRTCDLSPLQLPQGKIQTNAKSKKRASAKSGVESDFSDEDEHTEDVRAPKTQFTTFPRCLGNIDVPIWAVAPKFDFTFANEVSEQAGASGIHRSQSTKTIVVEKGTDRPKSSKTTSPAKPSTKAKMADPIFTHPDELENPFSEDEEPVHTGNMIKLGGFGKRRRSISPSESNMNNSSMSTTKPGTKRARLIITKEDRPGFGSTRSGVEADSSRRVSHSGRAAATGATSSSTARTTVTGPQAASFGSGNNAMIQQTPRSSVGLAITENGTAPIAYAPNHFPPVFEGCIVRLGDSGKWGRSCSKQGIKRTNLLCDDATFSVKRDPKTGFDRWLKSCDKHSAPRPPRTR